MSGRAQSWAADAFDAVSIWTSNVDVVIEGIAGDQAALEEPDSERFPGASKVEIIDRWLVVRFFEGGSSDEQATLSLPQQKAWLLQAGVWRGDVGIHGVAGRLQLEVRHGDLTVQDCRGVLHAVCGEGDVEIERWQDAAAPEAQTAPGGIPDLPMPPLPQEPPSPPTAAAWVRWAGRDLRDWGNDLSAQARSWGDQFRQAFAPLAWAEQNEQVVVRSARGDVQVSDIESARCALRSGDGDVTLERGAVADLRVHVGRGDVRSAQVMPAGSWSIEDGRGDVTVSLPANAQARVDVATRHGDITSDVPLVRVARPGPEARYGSRMVGALGQAGGAAEVSIAVAHGDIQIDVEPAASPYAGRQPQPANPPAPAEQPGERAAYTTEMDILQALSEGHINAGEAEQLLRSLGV